MDNLEQVKRELQQALIKAQAGLEADDRKEITKAIDNYKEVISVLSDVLWFYCRKTRSYKEQSIQNKIQMIANKREKYTDRLTFLLHMDEAWEDRMESNNERQPRPTSATVYQFRDYFTSYITYARQNPNAVWIPYSKDGLLGTIERIVRLCESVRYGAFVEEGLFVPHGTRVLMKICGANHLHRNWIPWMCRFGPFKPAKST